MSTTTIAPIELQQVNRYLYAGYADLTNLQSTVDRAGELGGNCMIVIPSDYSGGEDPRNMIRGAANIYMLDQRGGNQQMYEWVNGAYVYAPIAAKGGIGTKQINATLYPGIGNLPTIQSAIDFAQTIPTASFCIAITPIYTGSEVIHQLSNGSPKIYLTDQRTDEWQNYRWDGTYYVESDFHIGGDLMIDGDIYADDMQLIGNASIGGYANISGNLDAIDANFTTCVVGGSPVRTLEYNPGAGMEWPPAGIPVSASDHWGASIDPATIPYLNTANTFAALNTFPSIAISSVGGQNGTINYGKAFGNPAILLFDGSSNANSYGWGLEAGEMQFFVGTQPLGHFSWNAGGQLNASGTNELMRLDGATGILSLGTVLRFGNRTSTTPWQSGSSSMCSDSVNLVINPTGTGAIYLNFDQGNQGVKFGNGAGTVVAGIDQNGFFAAKQATITGPIYASEGGQVTRLRGNVVNPDFTVSGSILSANYTQGGGETDFFNVYGGGQGGFNWYSIAQNGTTPTQTATLSANGTLTAGGCVTTNGQGTQDTTKSYMSMRLAGGQPNLEWRNKAGTTDQKHADFYQDNNGTIHFRFINDGQTNAPDWMNAARSGTTPTQVNINTHLTTSGNIITNGNLSVSGTVAIAGAIGVGLRNAFSTSTPCVTSEGANILLNPRNGDGNIYMNWDSGIGSVIFGDGAAHSLGAWIKTGLSVTGTINATGAKNFVIRYPGKDGEFIVHTCLEGPEAGVFYRGEAITADGKVEITLPEYFEAIVRPENRSVQLTQIFEDDSEAIIGSNDFAMLQAGRVANGKFSVRSSTPIAKFFWQVNGVRADIDPTVPVVNLNNAEVQALYGDHAPKERTQDGDTATDRDREIVDGKHRAQAPSTASAASGGHGAAGASRANDRGKTAGVDVARPGGAGAKRGRRG